MTMNFKRLTEPLPRDRSEALRPVSWEAAIDRAAEGVEDWLGLNVGSAMALANAMAREIIHAGLADESFIKHATSGFEAYRACVERYTLEFAEKETGVPVEVIRRAAHAYGRADRA